MEFYNLRSINGSSINCRYSSLTLFRLRSSRRAGNTLNNEDSFGGSINTHRCHSVCDECSISSSYAYFGAGIASEFGTWNITNSVFDSNSVRHWGGGVYFKKTTGMVKNCTFKGNSIAQRSEALGVGGAAIYADESSFLISSSLIFNNTEITPNSPNAAILLYSDNSTIDGCTFDSNFKMGDIKAYRSTFTISNCKFTNTGAAPSVFVEQNSYATIHSCSISNINTIASVLIVSTSHAHLDNIEVHSIVTPNFAFSSMLSDVLVTNSVFKRIRNNSTSTTIVGGAMQFYQTTIEFRNLTCSDNVGPGGGCIGLARNATVSIYNSLFSNNNSTMSQVGDGGAIYVAHYGNDLHIEGCRFVGNNAINSGGAIGVDLTTPGIHYNLFSSSF